MQIWREKGSSWQLKWSTSALKYNMNGVSTESPSKYKITSGVPFQLMKIQNLHKDT